MKLWLAVLLSLFLSWSAIPIAYGDGEEEDLGETGTFSDDFEMDFEVTGTPDELDMHGESPTEAQVADITATNEGRYAPGSPHQGDVFDSVFAAALTNPYQSNAHLAQQNLIDKGFNVTLGQVLFTIVFYGYSVQDFSAPDIQDIFNSVAWANAIKSSFEVFRGGFEMHDTFGYAARFGL